TDYKLRIAQTTATSLSNETPASSATQESTKSVKTSLLRRSGFFGRCAAHEPDRSRVEPCFAFVAAQFAERLQIRHRLMQLEIVVKLSPIRIASKPIILSGRRSQVAPPLVARFAVREPVPGRSVARLALAHDPPA